MNKKEDCSWRRVLFFVDELPLKCEVDSKTENMDSKYSKVDRKIY